MLTIFFVIDGLSLEAHAALLAASLVHHNGDRFHCIGYVPDRHARHLSPALIRLMARCGVEIRNLPIADRPWAKPYPHGNKILAALDPRQTRHSMFLDTDILCLGPLDLTGLASDQSIAVVPEGRRSWGRDLDRWSRVYAHFGFDLPEERVQLSRNRATTFVPYFNAGMILFPETPLPDGLRFAQAWYDTAMTIDHVVPVAKKRPWLDQIALPVTLKRWNLGYKIADEALNYSAPDRKLKLGERPLLLHYHRWSHLADWPDQRQAALDQTRKVAGDALFAELESLYAPFWTATPAPSAPLDED